MNPHDGWISHLRKASRQQDNKARDHDKAAKCPLCGLPLPDISIESFRKHVQTNDNHESLDTDEAFTKAFKQMALEPTWVFLRPLCLAAY